MADASKALKTWDQAQIEEVCEFYRENAARIFVETGYHEPMTFLFANVNPETKEREPQLITVVNEGDFTSDTKERYSNVLREAAHVLDATGLIFITEAWTVSVVAEEEKTFREWEKVHGSLEHHSKRKEVLMFIVETSRKGSQLWTAEIQRDATGKPSLLPWVQTPSTGHSGRFVGILPQTS